MSSAPGLARTHADADDAADALDAAGTRQRRQARRAAPLRRYRRAYVISIAAVTLPRDDTLSFIITMGGALTAPRYFIDTIATRGAIFADSAIRVISASR